VVPFTHKSWDNWNELYTEIIKKARIIKESGITDVLRVANGGYVPAPDSLKTNTNQE
jgi:hypothetical protein